MDNLFKMDDIRGRKSQAVDTERYKEKRKTATFMEQTSDGFHEKQSHGRSYRIYGIREQIDPNNKI